MKTTPDAEEGMSATEHSERRIAWAHHRVCTCGGRGPNDKDACLACQMYHLIFSEPPPWEGGGYAPVVSGALHAEFPTGWGARP